jgi:predicted nucleic acid-binding Zn ribbon protein
MSSSEPQPRAPRYVEPKHIGDVLSQLIARRGYARVQSAGALVEAWNSAAGNRWTSCTRAMAVRRGVLEVLVGNSTLAQELGFQKRSLVKRLAELLPDEKIRDLKFKVGPLS